MHLQNGGYAMTLTTDELMSKDFHSCYEEYRQRFNRFADESDLKACINDLIVSEMEQNQFKHEPHLVHIALDAIKFLPTSELLNVDFAHSLSDYHFSYQDHKAREAIMSKKQLTSDKLIRTIELLGPPSNYIQALALSKLLNNINPHFMDPLNYQQYLNIREGLKISMSRFSHTDISNHLEIIERTQQVMSDQNDNYREILQNISTLQQNTDTTLQHIESTMPTQSEVNELRQELEAQGIVVNDVLLNVIQGNSKIQYSLALVLTSLKQQDTENQLRKIQQKTESDYQGLSNACHFVSQLGSVCRSKELYYLGNIAQHGVQIHKAMNQILSASLSGAALLGPYSAIGLAALNILTLFKHSPDPHHIIMKQIQALMRQIRSLHKEMISQFSVINERLVHLLEVITNGFEYTHLQLTAITNRKLFEVQNELKALTELTKAGFEELLLDKLRSQLAYVSDLELGISDINNVSQRDYEASLRFFSEFVIDRCCSPLFNGSLYQHLSHFSPIYNHQIISLLDHHNHHMFINFLSPLLIFAKSYALPLPDKLNEKNIFHPELWAHGVFGYIRLKKLLGHKFHYDPRSLNLKHFIQQAQLMLSLVHELRTNNSFYEAILGRIKRNHLAVQNLLSSVLAQETSKPKPHIQLMPLSIPEHLQKDEALIKIITAFFDTAKLFEKLATHHITLPQEFIQAAELGLGKIEYIVHLPSHLKIRTHHKHECKVLAGDTAGIEINFNLGGERINLYNATLIDRKTNFKKKSLINFLEDIVCKMSVPSADLQLKCTLIRESIDQQLSKNNKRIVTSALGQLTHSQAYAQLLQDTFFLLASLSCAGYPDSALMMLKETLQTHQLVGIFESYINNPEPALNLPTLNLVSHEQLYDFNLRITSWISNNANQSTEIIETLPDYVNTIKSCLSELSALMICDDLVQAVEKQRVYRDSGSSSFFAYHEKVMNLNQSERYQHRMQPDFSADL